MSCAGHFQKDCRGIDDYRFYIASENSVCKDYITEKLWWNAYRKARERMYGGIAGRAKAAIGYHGVVSSIPPSDLPTLSVVDEDEVTIFIKH